MPAWRCTARLTHRTHYEASCVLYQLKQGNIPSHITWEIFPEHIEILDMFIRQGMNPVEISETQKIISKRGTPMSADMIRTWIHKYLPDMQYLENTSQRYKKNKPIPYTKFLTSESNYEADTILYRILQGDIPNHITWEILPEHIEILKMFLIDGLNSHAIERTGKILSKRKKPMSNDMINIWIKRYFPDLD